MSAPMRSKSARKIAMMKCSNCGGSGVWYSPIGLYPHPCECRFSRPFFAVVDSLNADTAQSLHHEYLNHQPHSKPVAILPKTDGDMFRMVDTFNSLGTQDAFVFFTNAFNRVAHLCHHDEKIISLYASVVVPNKLHTTYTINEVTYDKAVDDVADLFAHINSLYLMRK